MNNTQWKLYRKKLAIMVSVAFVVASAVFTIFVLTISWQIYYGEPLLNKWEEFDKEIITSYQQYVDDNQLTKQEAMNDDGWQCIYNGVTIYLAEEELLTINERDHYFVESGIPVNCADSILYIHVTPSMTYGTTMGMIVGFIAAIIVFLLIIIPYINGLIREISMLTQEMAVVQQETVEHMKAKNEAIMANSKLITSLSHDFRTPLTRLTGYLEILKYRKFKGEEDFDKYLGSALRNAEQMKYLSDEMFSFFKVQSSIEASDPVDEKMVNELITGACNDLAQDTFDVRFEKISQSFELTIKEYHFRRVFDNLFSNVRKYADKSKPVEIHVTAEKENVIISILNYVEKNPESDSHGIGMTTVKILLEQCKGILEQKTQEDIFKVSVVLPVKNNKK